MVIGSLVLELLIHEAFSLKDKRSVVRSLKDKLKHRYNVSVAEVGEEKDVWNRAHVAIVTVSDSREHTDRQLQEVIRFVESCGGFILGEINMELL